MPQKEHHSFQFHISILIGYMLSYFNVFNQQHSRSLYCCVFVIGQNNASTAPHIEKCSWQVVDGMEGLFLKFLLMTFFHSFAFECLVRRTCDNSAVAAAPWWNYKERLLNFWVLLFHIKVISEVDQHCFSTHYRPTVQKLKQLLCVHRSHHTEYIRA